MFYDCRIHWYWPDIWGSRETRPGDPCWSPQYRWMCPESRQDAAKPCKFYIYCDIKIFLYIMHIVTGNRNIYLREIMIMLKLDIIFWSIFLHICIVKCIIGMKNIFLLITTINYNIDCCGLCCASQVFFHISWYCYWIYHFSYKLQLGIL